VVDSSYDISAILVVDTIPTGKVELKIDAKVYEDVKDKLLSVST